jgi:hypothetical protein
MTFTFGFSASSVPKVKYAPECYYPVAKPFNDRYPILMNFSNSKPQNNLQVSLAGASSRVGASSIGSGESVALHVRQNVGRGASQGTGVDVGDTRATNVILAGAGGGAVGGEESTRKRGRLKGGVDIGEVVTLSKNVTTGTNLEGMTGVVVPVVVDGVEVGVVLDLGGTATGLVKVVALESHLVAGSIEVHVPVVVTVASGGVFGFTINVVVGDGNTVVSFSAQDVVLTTNASSLNEESVSNSFL